MLSFFILTQTPYFFQFSYYAIIFLYCTKCSIIIDTCVSSQSALSCLATVASSTLLETPSSFHLLNTFNKKNDRLSVPIPVMKFITVGQGKLKVRSFYVSPSPTADVTEGIKHVISLYKEVGHQLASKQGVS